MFTECSAFRNLLVPKGCALGTFTAARRAISSDRRVDAATPWR